MKLISEIINELIDTEKSMTTAFLKTKFLASKLQNQTLSNWIDKELNGYKDFDELPDYREYNAQIKGTYINGNMRYDNQPVPTIGLEEDMEKMLRTMNFDQSIPSLETSVEQLKKNKNGLLVYTFPAEFTSIIEANWRKMNNPYLVLVNCNRSISGNVIVEILFNVRNKLLDFMLKIDLEFGNITEIDELKTKKEEIATIMSQTIINNSGDGYVVSTGENANINTTININKSNKEELVKYLQQYGISSSDTTELIKIIDLEKPNFKNKTFGENVNNWTQKMIGKVLDGSWEISIGTAATLIAESLKAYYGM